jgi:hypothetical protein
MYNLPTKPNADQNPQRLSNSWAFPKRNMSRLSCSPLPMVSWLSEKESVSGLTPVALDDAPFISMSPL